MAGAKRPMLVGEGSVAVALGSEQIWLFGESDLYFERSDQRHESDDADGVLGLSSSIRIPKSTRTRVTGGRPTAIGRS